MGQIKQGRIQGVILGVRNRIPHPSLFLRRGGGGRESPKLHKEGKNVMREHLNAPLFSTEQLPFEILDWPLNKRRYLQRN